MLCSEYFYNYILNVFFKLMMLDFLLYLFYFFYKPSDFCDINNSIDKRLNVTEVIITK